jgi:hypothetical protein
VPFVRLRDGLPMRLLQGQARFSETIAAAQRALLPPELIVDLAHGCLQAAGEVIRPKPASLAFYAMMARRCQQGAGALNARAPDLAAAYLREYAALVGDASSDYERVETALSSGMSADDFDYRRSRANKVLSEALGQSLAKNYLIQAQGHRPNTRYGLRLEPEAIRFESLQEVAGE